MSKAFIKPILIIITCIFFISCKTTKYVGEDQYLLQDYKIKSSGRIDSDELDKYVRQKSNKQLFGVYKLKLRIYSLFAGKPDKRINKWVLNNLAEEPVIYDANLTAKTKESFIKYLNNKGYYHPKVEVIEKIRKKKISVKYLIDCNRPYYIQQVLYDIKDTSLKRIVSHELPDTKLKRNILFDMDVLDQERTRLTESIREAGYFDFTKENITYTVDSAFNTYSVKLVLVIDDFKRYDKENKVIHIENHKQYKVRNIYIISDFDAKKHLEDGEKYYSNFDTVAYDNNTFFLYDDKPNVKANVILRSMYINSGDLYSPSAIRQTQKQLSSIRLFKLVNFDISDVSVADSAIGELDYLIQITPFTLQSYSLDLEGTNTGGDWGAQTYVSYQHKNIFNGAEDFNLKFKAALEQDNSSATESTNKIFNTEEYGADVSLKIPKFILPFVRNSAEARHRPQTHISAGYSYLYSPDYTRPTTNFTFGYFWQGNKYLFHTINPIDINGIRYTNYSDRFEDYIQSNDYYKFSFENYFIQASNYTLLFNNQSKKDKQDFQYLKALIETAGNFADLYILSTPDDSLGQIYDVKYARYIKGEVDMRYYNVISPQKTTIYRLFMGVAMPYSNQEVVPFIRKYYAGGSNSMRGWMARTLAPIESTSGNVDDMNYYMGDIKLEANIEHRFHLFWILNGALFVDIGNIWTFYEVEDQPQYNFKFDRFMDQLAVSTGFGTRFDLSFFVFRVDMGIKARDPFLTSNKWILDKSFTDFQNWNLTFGIGYPF